MNNHIYIFTRFSIYDKNRVVTTIQSQKNYSEFIFSNDRLNFKFKVFEKVTLPSINLQTYKNYTWFIYTSDKLPENYKIKLENLTRTNPKINIKYVDGFVSFFKDIDETLKNKRNYFTVRLDDDDGLNKHFFELLNRYRKYKKCIVSFYNGKKYTIKDDKIILGSKVSIKNIAAGVSANEMNIFNCGDHSKYHKKFKVIYNSFPIAYLLCCSKQFCDSKRSF